MTEEKLPLKPGIFYHIYNRGINGCPIFMENSNYEYFLKLYDKYISPVADTYAWVLMGNHFHFLVQIKNPVMQNPQGFKNLEGLKRINQQFSNLFNAYTKAFNKKYNRSGSLFEHTFKRIKIDNETYLKNMVLYIHQNPVHHGFCEHPLDWPWSSYLACIAAKPTKLRREKVIGWFDNEANFKYMHQNQVNVEEINGWLEI